MKFTWDSTFVDALGPREAIEIKPKSNTVMHIHVAHLKSQDGGHDFIIGTSSAFVKEWYRVAFH